MMSENKSYRVEYHFPRKCRSTNEYKKKDGRFANKNKTVSISALKSAALKKNKQTNKHTIKQTTTSKIRRNTTKNKSGHSDLVMLALKVHYFNIHK